MSKRWAEKYKDYGYIHKEKRGFVYTRALLNKARALPADRPSGGGHGGGADYDGGDGPVHGAPAHNALHDISNMREKSETYYIDKTIHGGIEMKVVSASLYGGPILGDVESRTEKYAESNVFASRHLTKLTKGELNLVFLPAENIKQVALLYKELGRTGEFGLAKTSQEARKLIDSDKFVCVLAASYQTGPGMLDFLYEVGVRLFTMSGNRRNVYVDGCGEREASGLSYSGVDLVGKLEDLGIIIDVSHTSDKGLQDILDVTSKATVVASHSNSRKICDNPRNLTDEQITQIAKRGGVIGVSMHPTMVSWQNPTLDDLIKHIITIKDLVGSNHVCIGTDYVDYIEDTFQHTIKNLDPTGKIYGKTLHTYPKDIETVAKINNIFKALKKTGMSEEDIKKIRGENVMSVFKRIEK